MRISKLNTARQSRQSCRTGEVWPSVPAGSPVAGHLEYRRDGPTTFVVPLVAQVRCAVEVRVSLEQLTRFHVEHGSPNGAVALGINPSAGDHGSIVRNRVGSF